MISDNLKKEWIVVKPSALHLLCNWNVINKVKK